MRAKEKEPPGSGAGKDPAGGRRQAEGGAHISDADRYLPLIYPFASALDYLPPDAVAVLAAGQNGRAGKEYIKQLTDDVKELNRRGTWPPRRKASIWAGRTPAGRWRIFRFIWRTPSPWADIPVEPRTMVSMQAKQLPSYAGSAQTAADDVELYLKQDFARWRCSPATCAGPEC
jgi:transcription-repair coupling factor (superfamily II helicase)